MSKIKANPVQEEEEVDKTDYTKEVVSIDEATSFVYLFVMSF